MIRGPIVKPTRSYYGVSLDQPDPSAELPHVYHPLRDAVTIVLLRRLAVHAVLWSVIVAAIVLGWGNRADSALVRAL